MGTIFISVVSLWPYRLHISRIASHLLEAFWNSHNGETNENGKDDTTTTTSLTTTNKVSTTQSDDIEENNTDIDDIDDDDDLGKTSFIRSMVTSHMEICQTTRGADA